MHREDWDAVYLNQDKILNKEAIANEEIIDFSYKTRIRQRAKVFDLDASSYLELVDVLEENSFWIDEIKRLGAF